MTADEKNEKHSEKNYETIRRACVFPKSAKQL